MPGATTTATTAAGVLLTTIMSLQGDGGEERALPVVRVNNDDGVLSDTEVCEVYEFDRIFESEFCSAFVTSRTSKSIFSIGETRAMKCMAEAETECVLSPEIGFGVPVAYISGNAGVMSIIAPKIMAASNPTLVRVSSPVDELVMRRASLNASIEVEFLSIDKIVLRESFTGEQAFCIQLLLRIFTSSCLDLLI